MPRMWCCSMTCWGSVSLERGAAQHRSGRAAAAVERADPTPVLLARTESARNIIEDAHWIDEVSESMFADFLTVIPQTHSHGVDPPTAPSTREALTRTHGAQDDLRWDPYGKASTISCSDEPPGSRPLGHGDLGAEIAGRAAGSVLSQEMARELADAGAGGSPRWLHMRH